MCSSGERAAWCWTGGHEHFADRCLGGGRAKSPPTAGEAVLTLVTPEWMRPRVGWFQAAHDTVAKSWGASRRGLGTPGARASSTRGVRAGDPFNRDKEGARGFIHLGACVLLGEVKHEARDGGEAAPKALATPVVSVSVRRESGTKRRRPRITEIRRRLSRLSRGNACGVQMGRWPTA